MGPRWWVQIGLDAKNFQGGARKVQATSKNMVSPLKAAAGAVTALAAAFGARQLVRSILQTDEALQGIMSRLRVATGSTTAAANEFSFLRAETGRLGLDLRSVSEDYGKFAAATKETALQGEATRNIFVGLAEASTALGLTSDQTRGALTALEQMISKGKVSAEELRGQLGERIPGAFRDAAAAIDVTTAELDRMLQAGELTAEELLPKLAARWREAFGGEAASMAERLGAQVNRMQNALFDLRVILAEELGPAFAMVVKAVTDLAKDASFQDFVRDASRVIAILINVLADLIGRLKSVASSYHEVAAAGAQFAADTIRAIQPMQARVSGALLEIERRLLSLAESTRPVFVAFQKLTNPFSADKAIAIFDQMIEASKDLAAAQTGAFVSNQIEAVKLANSLEDLAQSHLAASNQIELTKSASEEYGAAASGAAVKTDELTKEVVALVREFSAAENLVAGVLKEIEQAGLTEAAKDFQDYNAAISQLEGALGDIAARMAQVKEDSKEYAKLAAGEARVTDLLVEAKRQESQVRDHIFRAQNEQQQAIRNSVEALEDELRAARGGSEALAEYRKELDLAAEAQRVFDEALAAGLSSAEAGELADRTGVLQGELINQEEANRQAEEWADYLGYQVDQALGPIISEFLNTGKIDDWGAHFERVMNQVINEISTNLTRKLTDSIVDAAAGSGGGGGGFGTGGGAAGAVAGAAIFAAFIQYTRNRQDERRGEMFATNLQIGQLEQTRQFHGQVPPNALSNLGDGVAVVNDLTRQVRDFYESLGGIVTDFAGIKIDLRNDGEEFRVTVGEITQTFGDLASALEFGLLASLKESDFEGLGQNTTDVLKNIDLATTRMEDLQRLLEVAGRLDEDLVNPFTQAYAAQLRVAREYIEVANQHDLDMPNAIRKAQEALDSVVAGLRTELEAFGPVGSDAAAQFLDLQNRVKQQTEAAADLAPHIDEVNARLVALSHEVAETGGNGGDLTEDLRDLGDVLIGTGDRIDGAGDEIDSFGDRLGASLGKVSKEAELASISLDAIDASEVERAARFITDELSGPLLSGLANAVGAFEQSADVQAALAQAEQIRHSIQHANYLLQIEQLRQIGAISAAQLGLMERLARRYGQLIESGAISAPAPISISTGSIGGDGGFQQRERDRAALRQQFADMASQLAGTFSQLGVDLARQNDNLRSELERLSVFSADYIDQFIAMNTALAQQEFLAPFQAIVDQSTMGEYAFAVQEVERAREAALLNAEAMGLSADQMAVIREAFALQLQALHDEEDARLAAVAAAEAQAEAERELQRIDLMSQIEDLANASGDLESILSQRDGLIAAMEEFGITGRDAMHAVQVAAQQAVENNGLAWLEQTLNGIGVTTPEVTQALLELERAEILAQLAAYSLAGAFDNLADFDLQAVIEQINGAYDQLVQNALNPPRPITTSSATSGITPASTLADVLADMQTVIDGWTGPTLDQWEQEIARLNAIRDDFEERILAAGGHLSHLSPLLDALAVAIANVEDSALDSLRAIREELFFGAPTLLPRDQLERLEAQFNQLAAAALGGDLQARDDIAQVINDLYALLGQSFGTGSADFGRIDGIIQAFLDQILGPNPLVGLLPPGGPVGGSTDPFVGAGGSGFGANEGDRAPVAALAGNVAALAETVTTLGHRVEEVGSQNREIAGHVERWSHTRPPGMGPSSENVPGGGRI